MKRAVEAELASSGYAITEHDSQKWPACYSIADKNTDGAVTLFFGPILERAGDRILPYQVVREADSRESRMLVNRSDSPASITSLFLRNIHDILTNKLPAASPHDTGVGTGLLSIEEASSAAELQEAK
ncbi:MAG: hypothetical protein PHC88_09090 [Terrimicrobiaceae bacterium]|nr:hypothetical protein [Terrimicrobiaceae bacterium]